MFLFAIYILSNSLIMIEEKKKDRERESKSSKFLLFKKENYVSCLFYCNKTKKKVERLIF